MMSRSVHNRTSAVGVSTVTCATPPGLELGGFGARVGLSTGTHDPVTVRAFAVSDGVASTLLVVVDVSNMSVEDTLASRRRISADTGVPIDAIVIAVIHTHSAPWARPDRIQMNRIHQVFWEELNRAIEKAAKQALAGMVPAHMRLGVGVEATVARNRRIPGGQIDPTVSVLRADTVGSLGPDPFAVLVSYACHPVALGPQNLEVSADYPYYTRRVIEGVTGATSVFATGCSGQLNTGHLDRSFAEAKRLGDTVGGAALQTLGRIAPPGGEPDMAGMSGGVAASTVPVQLPRGDESGSVRSELGVVEASVTAFGWGNIRLVALPGEPFLELGLAIRDRSGHPLCVVIGYANGVPGYIPHESAYASGGYEVCQAYRAANDPGPFAADAGRNLVLAGQQALKNVDSQLSITHE